jgi:hypothetical protein
MGWDGHNLARMNIQIETTIQIVAPSHPSTTGGSGSSPPSPAELSVGFSVKESPKGIVRIVGDSRTFITIKRQYTILPSVPLVLIQPNPKPIVGFSFDLHFSG